MKESIFSKISTKPSKNALKWAGQEYSLLANIVLWTLWVCRVLSLLQILKQIYRKIITLLKVGTTDKNSFRPNVPPMFCELYFIAWFIVLILGHIFQWHNAVLSGFIVYYLFESVVWTLYYTVFRRFFEENYSIYHELEYLTVLMLVIPSQSLGFANLYQCGFRDCLLGLLNVGTDKSPFPVQILGALFSAIIISMIISSFPTEAIKKKSNKKKALIIGNGDVVQNRLKPALKRAGCENKNMLIYDIGDPQESSEACRYFRKDTEICDDISQKIDSKSVVFIETPTASHIGYLRKLLKEKAPLIVMEKPIASNLADIMEIENLMADRQHREKVFFLSYYILEKALPLTYLTTQNAIYENYLDIDDSLSLHNWRLRLGVLKSVDVAITEGVDTRKWAFQLEHGTQLLETFLHNVLIANLFCGRPTGWENCHLDNPNPNTYKMTAKSGKTEISLSLIKNAVEGLSRQAKFIFSQGSITADFDKRNATIYFNDLEKTVRISVKKAFSQKYDVLVDLVKHVSEGIYTAESVDGLQNQLEVIQWLLQFVKTSPESE